MPIGIPFPPDDIYKYRQTRVAIQNEIFVGNPSFIPFRAEYREGDGCFVYYAALGQREAPVFPSACVATSDSVYATNPVKRLIIGLFKFLSSITWRPKKLLNNFLEFVIDEGELSLRRFYLKEGYWCSVGKQLRNFTIAFFASLGATAENATGMGDIAASIVEYDNAYRYRIQDVLGETTKEALMRDFPKELERLIGIMAEREPIDKSVPDRFYKAMRPIRWAWKLWFVRRAVIAGLERMDLASCAMSEGELYHTVWFGNYNVKGLNFEERCDKIWKKYHGTDEATWPARIVMKG